jgi:hypothetical protein
MRNALALQRHRDLLATMALACVVAWPAGTATADPPALSGGRTTPVQTTACDQALNRRVLSEFGPYRTESEAASTFEKALRVLIDQGGASATANPRTTCAGSVSPCPGRPGA